MTNKRIRKYRCRRCQHQFDTDDDVPYCTACDSDSVEVIVWQV